MADPRADEIVVGVLGQWASGKTTAARILLRHLGGEGAVTFINDAVLVARQAVDHIRQLGDSQVRRSTQADGRVLLEGEHALVFLNPGEDLGTVDPATLHFDVDDDILPVWLHRARVAAGRRICNSAAGGKPVVVEAGFGRYPPGHTIGDLFAALQEAGCEAGRVKWIIVKAGFQKRWDRNARRGFGPPVKVFTKFAADGGDLDPAHQAELEAQGFQIRRVQNDHDDVKRLESDVIAAFEELFSHPEHPIQAA